MKNLARHYRTGGTTPPKSTEMLNEEKVVDFLNQPETEADKAQDKADKKAPGMDADQAKKPAKPPKKAASGGVMYARGAKVRGGGCEERGKTKGRFV